MQPGRIAILLGVATLAVVSGAVVLWTVRAGAGQAPKSPVPSGDAAMVASAPLHPVVIKQPAGAPKVATGLTNFHGEPVMASCASCHATTAPNREIRAAADLKKFHQGLKYAHGELSCLSCHNADNYETLRLADSRSVEFADSMTLCSQCHGPQRRDYDRGLHGGMTGHWDLRRGGRERNTCINCHDPHAPDFPLVMPVLPPRDRISVPSPAHSGASPH
ncbi:MAG: hypothetical protein IH623_22850 [Verrucomicrobia bacterium]|nr:hypothetical protein [Verrucomicrobiota bacterium]